MGNYLSLEQAAQLIGVNYSAFRQRRVIRDLAKSTDCICQGTSHVRLYPVDLFPDDVRGSFGDAKVEPTPPVGHPSVREASACAEEGISAIASSKIPSWEVCPKDGVGQLLDPNSKASRLVRAGQDLLRIQSEWCKCQGISNITKCDYAFAAAVQDGTYLLAPDILAQFAWGKSNGLSRGTLMRVRAKLQEGLSQGIRNLERPKDKKIDKRLDLRNYIIAYVHEYAHANMTVLRRELVKSFADVPSLPTLVRWVESYKTTNASAYQKSTNPDKWKNKFMQAMGSQSHDVVQPNQRWELDSTPADILLADGRYSVIAVIDVFTRRANLLVSNRSKADAIIALMRQTIMAWGVPEMVKTDNGADYASNAMANACAVLQIWQEFCPPYSPEKKPHVERFLGTFNHDWLPTLPGYAGHNVETRQAIRGQRSFADNRTQPDRSIELRLTAEQFQAACDNWVLEYNDRVHGSLGMQSPNTCWENARYFSPPADLRNLDRLLAFVGERKVLKDGISYGGGKYIAGDLLPGDPVQISIDASEMGVIYVFDMQGQFICNAYDDSLKGLDRQKIAKEAKEGQQRQIAVAMAEVKTARSESNFKKIQREVVAERTSGKVVDLPTPSFGHPSVERCASVGFPDHEGATREGTLLENPKVVSITKPRTATPEQLFERAWEMFSTGSEVVMPEVDCDRVWFAVTSGDSETTLAGRTDREGQKQFLSCLGALSPASKRKA